MLDLGTLGGPDSFAWWVNNLGQVTGVSYTNATVNPATGQPTEHPFLWENGKMRDLGTLGGSVPTFGGVNALNDRGEVVGQSDLTGDQSFHPFLWNGGQLLDLGTFGGNFGTANSLNAAGHVAGWATTPGNATAHGFLWKNGTITDLGTLPGQPCSFANSVNALDQVVGGSCTSGGNVWLWEHGTLYDVNTLVAPSALRVTEALTINDRGEITGVGVLPNGDHHDFLLVPNGLAHGEGLTSHAPLPDSSGPTAMKMSSPGRIELLPLLRASWLRGYPLRSG
jgi:probable HAF family extracellular repeat protein